RLLYFLLGLLFAGVGNLAYFYMESKLRENSGYVPKVLKSVKDTREVISLYSALTRTTAASPWPVKLFYIGLVGTFLCGLLFFVAVLLHARVT
ncbi:MAG TPA: hypothetical protein VGF06_06390, partial [Terriglobales bacterium]